MKKSNYLGAQAKFTRFLNGDRVDGSGRRVKKGMASFYVVIFAILVFIVLVLAFINIMLSETLQSSGSDLSASALDSAQAGVEDAKTAIMQCLASHGNSTDALEQCSAQLFSGECNSLASYLYGSSEAEVSVGDVSLNQAYTCVTLDNEVESLRATLSPNDSNGSVFIVPLYKADSGYSSVQISWYSDDDRQGTTANLLGSVSFPRLAEMSTNVPMLQVQMISASTGGSPADVANSAVSRGAAVLVPVSGGGSNSGNLQISGDNTTLGGTQVKKNFEQEGSNAGVPISCSNGDGYACTYTIGGSISDIDYLVFTNPYNDREVSVEVTACSGGSCNGSNAASFTNVQVEVDSTGRASSYYRRIQTRLTLADPDVPVPTYALSLGGSDALTKTFAVTRNCWRVESNSLETCENGVAL